ncbi:MAG TPA: pilus assembly protein PilY, partial [Pseudomonadales bacterium]|nr:pilus assembly protein PilY [Pseudomonadales bacterium]
MIFTLDESGSMSWGYTPDNIVSVGQSRRILSNTFNSQYYNPNVAYTIPPAFDSSGAEYQLSTSFAKAYHNGFVPDNKPKNQSYSYLNLNSGYRVTQEHRIPSSSGTFTQLANPSVDFYMKDSETVKVYTSSGDVKLDNGFLIRYNNNSCKVVLNGYEYSTKECSYSSRNDRLTYRYDLRTTAVPAYYYVYNSKKDASCTIDDEGCYSIKFVTDSSGTGPAGKDERENFAIWFSFYKTRALATLSATSIAFYDLSSDVRFTWQNLATCTSFTSTSSGGSCGKNSLKPYTSGHKGEFYTWLRSVYFNTGTPLPAAMKRAGEYLKTSTPWEKYPGEKSKNNTDNTYACRPSYHVLMTDGMWNATVENPDNFRHDKDAFTTPVGETIGAMEYKQYKPFYDATAFASSGGRNPTYSGTLADIAMHYWATDLNSDLDNKVSSYIPYKNDDSEKEYWDPRNNPAEWQSMSNFIMGLGLTNSLNNTNVPWAGSTFAGEGYAKLKSGAASWPAASSGSDNNVYDLWHAAINSRGEFYSVDTPEAMVQAFIDILTRIADRKDSAAMPGVSTSLESDGAEEDAADRLASYFYQTTFDSGDGWAGDIQKVKKYRKYNEDTKEFEDVVEQGWSAKSRMPSADSRNIMIAGGGTSKLKAFSTTNAGDPDADAVGSLASYLKINPEPGTQVATWQQRLEYIRGSKANEGEGAGKLRQRSSILGDFLSSQPVIVSGGRY